MCSYNLFSDRITFGAKDGGVYHAVEPLLGEVSDKGLTGLRQALSAAFGFDLGDQYVRTAVETLALEHSFDPVVDMFAGAEANWDGVKRLDRMAAEYMACDDTPLNAAFMRKTMIAGVARTGPIPPFVTALADAERAALEPVARELLRLDSERRAAPVGKA